MGRNIRRLNRFLQKSLSDLGAYVCDRKARGGRNRADVADGTSASGNLEPSAGIRRYDQSDSGERPAAARNSSPP